MKGETFVEGLIKILVKRKIIETSEAEALKKSFRDSPKPNFDEFLLDEGLVDKDDLLPALADLYQVPAFDAVGYFFNHQLVRMFPKIFLRSNGIVPIERDQNILIILASNPSDSELLPLIGNYVSYDIQFRVGIRQDIFNAIQEFYDQSVTGLDYDEGLDENRAAREDEIRQEREVEKLAREDFERDE